MKIVKQNLTNAVGSLQSCAGQETVSNAAIHTMHSIFEANEAEATLLQNVFNSINWK